MNEIKKISIKHFLELQGISPKQEYQYYGMYNSPIREDKTASFKVDYNKNLWYDFGLEVGGSIIDLVMRLDNCTISDACNKLRDNQSFSFHSGIEVVHPSSAPEIMQVSPLANSNLLSYLTNRRIDLGIAKRYCRELHYSINSKTYYGIGFKNDAGGWEVRNEYFKGCIAPKAVSTFSKGSKTCLLFEGFVDMLSYLTLKKPLEPSSNIIVLNSVHKLGSAVELVRPHEKVHCFFDNDDAGRDAFVKVGDLCSDGDSCSVVDASLFYKGYKDLNEYLVKQGKKKIVVRGKTEIYKCKGRKM